MWIFNLAINNYPALTILWNLLLLIIPFFLCRYLLKFWKATKFKKPHQKISAVILGFVWLIFIPNAAYIITDVRHLLDFCPVNEYRVCIKNAWMIMFFFTYAAAGWAAFVYLLNQMKFLVNEIYGKLIAKVYIWLIIPVISLGVLLGLINRWNSWEVFIYFDQIIRDALMYFTDFMYFKNWLMFTVFLYLLYFGGNMLFIFKIIDKDKKVN